jgi:hypothetical protein
MFGQVAWLRESVLQMNSRANASECRALPLLPRCYLPFGWCSRTDVRVAECRRVGSPRPRPIATIRNRRVGVMLPSVQEASWPLRKIVDVDEAAAVARHYVETGALLADRRWKRQQ